MNDNCLTLPSLGVQDNQSAVADRPDSEGYLGRRVEADGSWTTYHVFTGAPARVSNRMMTGLTKAEATTTMVRRNADGMVK